MKVKCKHCGTGYRAKEGVDGFCCSGCAHVYVLIQEEGLGGFYAQQQAGPQPVGDRPFRDLDFSWASELQRSMESSGANRVVLRLGGMSCVGCVWLVERLCQRATGVKAAKASLTGQLLRLEWEPGTFDLRPTLEELHRFGYTASESLGTSVWTAMDWRCLLSVVFAVNSVILAVPPWQDWGFTELSGLFHLLSLLCLCLSALAGGAYFLVPLYRSVQRRQVNGESIRGGVVLVCTVWAMLSWWLPGTTTLSVGDWWYPVLMVAMLLPDWLAGRLGLERPFVRWHGVLGGVLGFLLLGTFIFGLLAWVPVFYAALGLLFLGLCAFLPTKDDSLC